MSGGRGVRGNREVSPLLLLSAVLIQTGIVLVGLGAFRWALARERRHGTLGLY